MCIRDSCWAGSAVLPRCRPCALAGCPVRAATASAHRIRRLGGGCHPGFDFRDPRMTMKKGIWHAFVLTVFCTGTVSCSFLPDILVKPFESSPTTQKKQVTQKKQAKSCYPVRDRDIVYIVRKGCLLYTSPSPRDRTRSRMPSSA